jgi:hypothetical protein
MCGATGAPTTAPWFMFIRPQCHDASARDKPGLELSTFCPGFPFRTPSRMAVVYEPTPDGRDLLLHVTVDLIVLASAVTRQIPAGSPSERARDHSLQTRRYLLADTDLVAPEAPLRCGPVGFMAERRKPSYRFVTPLDTRDLPTLN